MASNTNSLFFRLHFSFALFMALPHTSKYLSTQFFFPFQSLSLLLLSLAFALSNYSYNWCSRNNNNAFLIKLSSVHNTWSQFHKHFTYEFFVRISPQSQNVTRKSCWNDVRTKNSSVKTLMKLTPGVNSTNILRTNFSYEFLPKAKT